MNFRNTKAALGRGPWRRKVTIYAILAILLGTPIFLNPTPAQTIPFWKVFYDHRLYATGLYIEYYQNPSRKLNIIEVTPRGTRFFVKLEQFRAGYLVYSGLFELKPVRYFSFLRRIERRFFPKVGADEGPYTKKAPLKVWQFRSQPEANLPQLLSRQWPVEQHGESPQTFPLYGDKDPSYFYVKSTLHGRGPEGPLLEKYVALTKNQKAVRALYEIVTYFNAHSIPRPKGLVNPQPNKASQPGSGPSSN